MIKEIGNYMEQNSIISGLIFIGIGLVALAFRLKGNNSFRMKDYGLISWRLLVQTWGLIVMFILAGIIIILKNS